MQHPWLTREKGGILTSINKYNLNFRSDLPVNLSLDSRYSRVLNVCEFVATRHSFLRIILAEGNLLCEFLIEDLENTNAFGYRRVLGKIGMPCVSNVIN